MSALRRLLTVGGAAALAFPALAAPTLSQGVPTRTLAKPDVEYSEPFTQLTGVRELRDGRVIAIDPRDKVIEVVDLKAGTAEKLGREGSGPGEYGLPTRLFALPGDTSGVVDLLNNRILLITPQAKVGGFVDLNVPQAGGRTGGGGMMVGASLPSSADAKGRMYVQGPPIQIVNGTPQSADSMPMIRWDRASGKRDTVAWLQAPKGASQISGGRGNMSIRVGSGAPFAGADQIAVAPDGRVAIAHHDPYRVEYVNETGQRTQGQPIAYEKVKVSEAHKQEWRDRMKTATGMMISMNNGQRSAAMVPMRNVEDPETWGGEYMPPFLSGATSISFANDGFLWVQRTGPAGQPPTFDLIDRAGRLVQKVVLPKRTRLVGFGNGAIYTVRLDEDDLQYLQRYRFTMPERP